MNNCVLIRTLIAMVSYILHRLMMGKVEVDNSSVSMGIFVLTDMFIE